MRSPTLRSTRDIAASSPFNLEDPVAYHRWREAKLASVPAHIDDLLVEVRDPRALTQAERQAILQRCAAANMAVYQTSPCAMNKDIVRALGRQVGLRRLAGNWLADEDGISQVTVAAADGRELYIPYTSRALNWHTDGYYNPADRRIRAMLLHCAAQARTGGENALLDHEIAYLLLRDENPGYVAALMAADAMTIPARTDEDGVARPAET